MKADYEQCICINGHYFIDSCDGYDYVCTTCGACQIIWSNLVEIDEYGFWHGKIPRKVLEDKFLVASGTYRKPTEKESKELRSEYYNY